MKILHIITRLILGGAQQNTVMSCAAQVAAGHEVTLAYGPIYGPEGSLLEQARASGAQLVEVSSMHRSIRPMDDVRCYFALRRLIRELRPDVVHTHSSKAGIVGRAAAWAEGASGGVPAVIHTVHGLPFHDHQPRWVHRMYVALERYAAKRCHHLIAITSAMVDAFTAKGIAGPERFTVIPSGVELSRFERDRSHGAAVRDELGVPHDVPVLGIVARLDPLKGHDDLLAIMPTLLERLPTLRLLLIGDGFHRSQIEAQLADKPWREQVMLTGLVPHDRVGHLLTAVDVKALPSYQEGQSRTLIEALLCGCGIVAYNVGGMPSICVDGETGKLVEPGDRAALAEAIAWMFEHPDERAKLIAKGQSHVREQFDARRMVAMIEQVYERQLQSTDSNSGVAD
ncbi:glycosyltransferase family 4 protein [Phycisphaerales bacterium AB-hyl4]|uniref:Glycosyltransferase family 4 protein n=1 Tax=Natronomicrosphaera hydrolytica TaxID=3242702 RepID=A0ABV4U9E1_9BACT